MFPACCFRQRTYVTQGHVNEVFIETQTHSCFNGLPFNWDLYRGHSAKLVFDIWYVFAILTYVVVCAYVCVKIVSDFNYTYFFLLSLSLSLSLSVKILCAYVCVWWCGLKFTGNYILLIIFSQIIFVCVYIYTYMCIFVSIFVCV